MNEQHSSQLNHDDTDKKSKALYFDGWYKEAAKPVNFDDLGKTGRLHVDKIVESGAQSALDIGCGAGGILLALQSKGVQNVYGVDASEDAIKLAEARFAKFGDNNGFHGVHADMTHIETPQTDAVSLHRVLCCFNDYEALLDKATAEEAKTIVLTYPRNTFYNKFLIFVENLLLGLTSIFRKRLRGIRGYNHSNKQVKQSMITRGYELSYEDKTIYWKTEVYTKITESED